MFQIAILQLDETTGNVVTYHKASEMKANVIAVVNRDSSMVMGRSGIAELVGAAFDEVERELALRTVGVEPEPV